MYATERAPKPVEAAVSTETVKADAILAGEVESKKDK